jgi:hypothetical protein
VGTFEDGLYRFQAKQDRGEAKLHMVGAVHTQSFVAAKNHKGEREPRSLTKEWAVQVDREAKEEVLSECVRKAVSNCAPCSCQTVQLTQDTGTGRTGKYDH